MYISDVVYYSSAKVCVCKSYVSYGGLVGVGIEGFGRSRGYYVLLHMVHAYICIAQEVCSIATISYTPSPNLLLALRHTSHDMHHFRALSLQP
jgi:hypothetical protein